MNLLKGGIHHRSAIVVGKMVEIERIDKFDVKLLKYSSKIGYYVV